MGFLHEAFCTGNQGLGEIAMVRGVVQWGLRETNRPLHNVLLNIYSLQPLKSFVSMAYGSWVFN